MKKFILFFVILSVICLVACNGSDSVSDKNDDKPNGVFEKENDIEETQKETEAPEEIDPTSWGVPGRFSARNSNGTETCYINLPYAAGVSTGYGWIVINHDRVAILYGGQNDKAPSISSVSELFPAYFEHIEFDLRAFYGVMSDDYEFKLDGGKAVTIGDYDMHKFDGSFSFVDDGEKCNYPFTAYATKLKSNGAYAYWFVYDISDDQSNGKLVDEHALNIAKTFREEQ